MRFTTLCSDIKSVIQQKALDILDKKVKDKYLTKTIGEYTTLVNSRDYDPVKETYEEYQDRFYEILKNFKNKL